MTSGQPLRKDDVFVANLYAQDMPAQGFTSQVTVVYNRNREGEEDHFEYRRLHRATARRSACNSPRDYDIVYLGYNGDGHFGALQLDHLVLLRHWHGRTGDFVSANQRIRRIRRAGTVARFRLDFRARLSLLYGSGDKNPYEHRATGFDAIHENPQFAGGDTSYWISQAVPLVGGGGVTLAGGQRRAEQPAFLEG